MAADVLTHAEDCACRECLREWLQTNDEVPAEGAQLDRSQRARLALATDLLAAWARYAEGNPVPTDEALADALIEATRARGKQATTLFTELAGGALARALAHLHAE